MVAFGTLTYVWGERCVYCGDAAETIDHVLPLYRGGVQRIQNLRPACSWCNQHKHDATPEEWLGKLCPEWLTGFHTPWPYRHGPGTPPWGRNRHGDSDWRRGGVSGQPSDAKQSQRRYRRHLKRAAELRLEPVPIGVPPAMFYRPLPHPLKPFVAPEGVVIRPLPDEVREELHA